MQQFRQDFELGKKDCKIFYLSTWLINCPLIKQSWPRLSITFILILAFYIFEEYEISEDWQVYFQECQIEHERLNLKSA